MPEQQKSAIPAYLIFCLFQKKNITLYAFNIFGILLYILGT